MEFCGFVTVEPGGKRNKRGRVRKSDLGEKKRISGKIKVKRSLHDHSEINALQRMHS